MCVAPTRCATSIHFAQIGELLLLKLGRRLRQLHARADAVDLDAVAVRLTAQRAQVVGVGARQPVDSHVDAVGPGVDRDIDQVLVLHRLALESLAIRIGDEARPEARSAHRRLS
jgi:hypothetical protein